MRLDRDVFQEGPMGTFGETEHGVRAAFSGALHAIGGLGARNLQTDPPRHDYREDNDRYEPAFDIWRACADMLPPRRFSLAGFVIGPNVHVTGGQKEGTGLLIDHDVYKHLTDTWIKWGELPYQEPGHPLAGGRFLHAGFTIPVPGGNDVGCVCGGKWPGGITRGTTDIFLEAFNMWWGQDNMADPVGEHAAVAAGGYGYAFGGSTGGPIPPFLQTTQRFDLTMNLWVGDMAEMLQPGRRELCGAKVGRDTHEYCMVFGGRSYDVVYTRWADRYDPINDSWLRQTSLPKPARHWSNSAGIEDLAYVVGGEGDDSEFPYNLFKRDCDEYNHLTNSWTTRKPVTDTGHGRLEVLSVTV